MKFKVVLLITFIYSLSNHAFGQQFFTVKEPNYASPNAASLGKYGNIPVSYHTGVPNISVPVFTIHEGALTLPISLNYHSSGVLVNETSSWIGLGWSLSAGGMVSQSIMGGPDEGKANTNTSWGTTNRDHWGWYKDGGIPPEIINCQSTPIDAVNGYDASGNHCSSPYLSSPTCFACLTYYKQAAEGGIDTEPDLFTYNFNGQSGKFFFDQNKKVHGTPENDLFIKPVDNPSIFSEWVIITPDGTKYKFGKPAATETTYTDPLNYNNGTSDNNKSSRAWYLYRIESANGEDWIVFDYVDEYYSFGNRHQQSVAYDYIGTMRSGNENFLDGTLVTSTVKGKRLSKITTSSGDVQIDFIPSAAPRQDLSFADQNGSAQIQAVSNVYGLAQIMITYGDKKKYLNLGQSYFTGSSACGNCGWPLIDNLRLKLDYVQETDGITTLPKYQFTYNATQLPRRYSLARDEWEYYNGYDNNDGLIPNGIIRPNQSNMPVNSGDYRLPNETAMQAGILTQITYPTGGYTTFEYQAHRESATSAIVGGLRVKTITDNDGNGTVGQKNFTYGSGLLFYGTGWPYYTHDLNNPNRSNYWQQQPTDDYGTMLTSSPSPSYWSTQGYHIGYYDVTVDETGNGKTTYYYHNESFRSIPANEYPMKPLVSNGTTGELINELVYANGGINPIAGTYNTKNPGTDVNVLARRVVSANSFLHPIDGGPVTVSESFKPLYNDYTLTTSRFRLTSQATLKDGLTVITNYEYGNDTDIPTAEITTGSDGTTYRKEITYPNSPGSGAPSIMFDPATGDNYKHMIGDAVKQTLITNGTTTQQLTNQFTATNNNIYLTNSRTYATGGTDYTEKNYTYDALGNLQVISPKDGAPSTFIWGYNGKHLIGIAKNAAYQESPATSPRTATFGTGISTNVSACTNLTGTLTIGTQQSVSFNANVTLAGSTGLSVSLTLKRVSDGLIVFAPKTYVSGSYNETTNQLAPGTYQFCYTASGYPTPYTGYSSINVTVNYAATISRKNVFSTSFEDDGAISATPKTGNKVWPGALQLATPALPGKYILSYWLIRYPSTQWVYQQQLLDYTTATPPNEITVGQSGDLLDELRLYPVGAQMTTYTYDPVVGITSTTDAKGLTTYYEYDSFQRLINIKDKDGNIIKHTDYHYQQ